MVVDAFPALSVVASGRFALHLGEYLKSLDQERTGRVLVTKIKEALTQAARQPAPDQVMRMLMIEKQVRWLMTTMAGEEEEADGAGVDQVSCMA